MYGPLHSNGIFPRCSSKLQRGWTIETTKRKECHVGTEERVANFTSNRSAAAHCPHFRCTYILAGILLRELISRDLRTAQRRGRSNFPTSHTPPLPQYQAQGSQSGGARRQRPGELPGPPGQPSPGEGIFEVPGAVRVVRVVVDVEEARVARMDEWIVWKAEEGVARGAPD